MPDPIPTSDLAAAPHPRRHAAPAAASRAEVLAVVERASRVPDGLALLERAPLECVAVLLGVEPRTIERVRVALADPATHAEAARHLAGAAGRRRAPAAPTPAPRPRDPEALLAAARERADGLALLCSAAPETAAIAFGVHPDLVHGARALAARGPGAPPAP